MDKCSAYRPDGKYAVCIATKECDPCNCNGDRSKCELYENVCNETKLNIVEDVKKQLALQLAQRIIEDNRERNRFFNFYMYDRQTNISIDCDETIKILKELEKSFCQKVSQT